MVCSMERQASRELSPRTARELQSRPIKQSLPGPHPQVIRWRNSLPSCQKSYCASNRCRYSFGVQCFSSRKVLMK